MREERGARGTVQRDVAARVIGVAVGVHDALQREPARRDEVEELVARGVREPWVDHHRLGGVVAGNEVTVRRQNATRHAVYEH
jgi:hypothetical protein